MSVRELALDLMLGEELVDSLAFGAVLTASLSPALPASGAARAAALRRRAPGAVAAARASARALLTRPGPGDPMHDLGMLLHDDGP